MKKTKQQWHKWLMSHDWMLSSDDNGKTHGGFEWHPKNWVTAPDWDESAKCGSGLHGMRIEANGFGFMYPRIVLRETKGKRVVIDGDKIKVKSARVIAIEKDIPAEAFELIGYNAIYPKDGDTINDVRDRDVVIVTDGVVTVNNQSGGESWAYGNATLNSTNQSGGSCRAYDTATLNSTNQSGGVCRAHGTATLNSTNQSGGVCRAHGTATLNSTNQSGGGCWAQDTATLNSTNQSGGGCWAQDTATLNSTNQSGGSCRAYDTATLNSTNQSGGGCTAQDTATLIQK